MMEFSEVVRRRRMVRRYRPDRPVPASVRDAILDVARRAPSAGFSQGTSFLILEAEADRERFWSITAPDRTADSWLVGMRTAPLLIMVWASELAYRRRYAEPDKALVRAAEPGWPAPFWYVDAGMAAMAALYAVVDAVADAEGELGACFFGLPIDRVEAVRAGFGVPSEQLQVGVISVGYRERDERPSGSPIRRRRKESAEVVHHGQW